MNSADRDEEFRLVVEVRKLAGIVNKNVSEKTERDYLNKYERMLRTGYAPENAGSKRAYYAYRAALLFGMAMEAAAALRLRDKSPYLSEDWQSAMLTIKRCANLFERYPPDPQRTHWENGSSSFTWEAVRDHKAKTQADWSPCVKSKKRVLSKLRKITDWQSELFSKVTTKHKSAAAVCALIGARPSEIARGVHIQIAGAVDNPHLLITIRGTKLTATSGQPERQVLIKINRPEARHLYEQCLASGKLEISTHPANLTAAVIKAGKKAFPTLKMTVSPYVWRHSVGAELKAAGVSEEEIAQTLGHQATKSQQAYGLPVHASGSHSIVAVAATMPVRMTHRHPGMMFHASDAPTFHP